MVLDTGATPTILEAYHAIAAALRVVATNESSMARARGVGGLESARGATVHLLTVGDLCITNVAAVILL
jgi:hypothetical protein